MTDEVTLPDTKTYRVVMGFAVYDSPRADYDVEGKGRVIYTRESGMRSEEVELVPREAKRLLDLGAVVPADTPRGYEEMDDDELAAAAADRSLVVTSSSADPDRPLRDDFINALRTLDQGIVVGGGVGSAPGGITVGGAGVARSEAALGGEPAQVGEATEIDAGAASVEEIAAFISDSKPNADETVALAQDDPTLAQKVLTAEKSAQGGDGRKTVSEPLEKIIEG